MGEDIYIASDNNVGWNNQTLFSSRAARGGGGAKKREMLTPHLVWRGKKGGRRIREANWNSWSPVESHFSPHAVEFKFSETFFPPLKLGNTKQVFFRSAAPNLHSFAFWKCQPSSFHIKKKREKESCKNFNRRRRLEKKKFCLTAALEEKLFLWSSSKSLDYTLRIKKPWWFRPCAADNQKKK